SFHVLRVSPEYFDLFRARDEQGRSITQLLVSDPDARVLSGAAARRFFPGQSAVGKQVSTSRTLENPLRVVAVVPHFRSNDFDREEACYFQILQGDLLRECVETFGKSVELCVRMKRSMTTDQMMKFLSDASERLQAGDLYVSGVKELSKQRVEILKTKLDIRKQQMAVILFLLVNVFFGVAGTFWLRTERRRGEIGLRLAMGSNRQQIGQVLYTEGLILLSLTLPFLLLLIFNLLKVDLLDTYREAYSLLRLVATVGASYLLMALMICLGIYYPARVAKHLPPAEALREE
ncbi:MAG: ABC transporter permease, partial [Parabacteroides sp.]